MSLLRLLEGSVPSVLGLWGRVGQLLQPAAAVLSVPFPSLPLLSTAAADMCHQLLRGTLTERSLLLPISMMVMFGLACCRASSSQLARWLNVSRLHTQEGPPQQQQQSAGALTQRRLDTAVLLGVYERAADVCAAASRFGHCEVSLTDCTAAARTKSLPAGKAALGLPVLLLLLLQLIRVCL